MKSEELDEQLAGYGDSVASATRVTPGHALRPEDIALKEAPSSEDIAEYALWLGDDALILSQRLQKWVSNAPEMEEDIALANIALDLLGHARSFLTFAGKFWDKDEDELAYFRDEDDFRNLVMVEQPNGHFGVTIARQLLFSVYLALLYSRLVKSADEMIAAIADKSLREVQYHVDHAQQWTLRLGLGTEESHEKMVHAFRVLWPHVEELFIDHPLQERLAEKGIAVLPSTLREEWDTRIKAVLEEASLEVPEEPGALVDGRSGNHSEHLGYILMEMQVLARRHPGVKW